MSSTKFREEFLLKTHTTEEQQNKYGENWDLLQSIHDDYVLVRNQLENVGEAYSKLVQRVPGVHSVRWRSKDPIGLIDKIIRKISENSSENNKYKNITVSNYRQIITDLIGVRALYLFKNDIDHIHENLLPKLHLHEKEVIFYHREGDFLEDGEKENRIKQGFTPRIHPAGYRSIHYICEGGIDRSFPVIFELQVRSLNDEAWSEVDHKIRYPNFDDNPLILQLLQILNRLSGSADEMSNFVKILSIALQQSKQQSLQRELEHSQIINELRSQIDKMKSNTTKKNQKAEDDIETLIDKLVHEEKYKLHETFDMLLQGNLDKLQLELRENYPLKIKNNIIF